MEARTFVRAGMLVLCVGVTALGYRNSNGDNSDAIALATKAACEGDGCTASLGQQARGSFGHEYSFETERTVAGKKVKAQVIVACERAQILVGDWHCAPKARPPAP